MDNTSFQHDASVTSFSFTGNEDVSIYPHGKMEEESEKNENANNAGTKNNMTKVKYSKLCFN